jgi:hypothetical protein
MSKGSSQIEIPPVGVSRSSWIMFKTFHKPDPITCSLILPDGSEITSEIYESSIIRSLIGAWIIQELEFLMHSNPADDTIQKILSELGIKELYEGETIQSCVYAENTSKFLQKMLAGIIEKISLDYGIASSETAFFASRTEQGKPTGIHVIVPSALPEGWSDDFAWEQKFHAYLFSDVQHARPPRWLDDIVIRQKFEEYCNSIMQNARDPENPLVDNTSCSKMSYLDNPCKSESGGNPPDPGIHCNRDKNKVLSKNEKRIMIFKGIPIFHDNRAVLFDSEKQTEESELLKTGVVSDIIFKISGDDYDWNHNSSIDIEIFDGTKTEPINSYFIHTFISLGHISWPDPDLIRSRYFRVVIYDPKGVCINQLISLELIVEFDEKRKNEL